MLRLLYGSAFKYLFISVFRARCYNANRYTWTEKNKLSKNHGAWDTAWWLMDVRFRFRFPLWVLIPKSYLRNHDLVFVTCVVFTEVIPRPHRNLAKSNFFIDLCWTKWTERVNQLKTSASFRGKVRPGQLGRRGDLNYTYGGHYNN